MTASVPPRGCHRPPKLPRCHHEIAATALILVEREITTINDETERWRRTGRCVPGRRSWRAGRWCSPRAPSTAGRSCGWCRRPSSCDWRPPRTQPRCPLRSLSTRSARSTCSSTARHSRPPLQHSDIIPVTPIRAHTSHIQRL